MLLDDSLSLLLADGVGALLLEMSDAVLLDSVLESLEVGSILLDDSDSMLLDEVAGLLLLAESDGVLTIEELELLGVSDDELMLGS